MQLCIIRYFYRILKETVFKDALPNNILFKFEISLIFIKKASRAIKIPKDIRIWIKDTKFAGATAKIVELGILVEEKISKIRKTLGKALKSPIWSKTFAGIVNLGAMVRKKIFEIRKILRKVSKSPFKSVTFADIVNSGVLTKKRSLEL